MEKILITGVAGFIGSKVASRFVKEGFEVIGVDDLSNGKKESVPQGLSFIEGNLSDTDFVDSIKDKIDLILHSAGQSSGEISFDDPKLDIEKNTTSTLNLISLGIRNGSKRIVYASSMSVYGDVPDEPVKEITECKPLSCYGVSKLASENYLNIYKDQIPYTSLRMFNVYGPGQDMSNLRQGMVSIYLSQAMQSGTIQDKGSTDRFRDFIYIDDVVEAWFAASAIESGFSQVINVGTGIRTTIQDLLNEICHCLEKTEFYVDGSTLGDQKGIYADTNRLAENLGLTNFINLSEGIKEFTDSLLEVKEN